MKRWWISVKMRLRISERRYGKVRMKLKSRKHLGMCPGVFGIVCLDGGFGCLYEGEAYTFGTWGGVKRFEETEGLFKVIAGATEIGVSAGRLSLVQDGGPPPIKNS